MKIRDARDFWSGIMFAVFGAAFVGFSQSYAMGSAARMGPAYFPTLLGGLLFALGVLITLKSLSSRVPEAHVDKFHFKPLVVVLGAVVAFGMLLRPGGLLVAVAALVGISSLGSGEFRWREVVPLAIALALLVLGVFIWGLGMTIPVLPAFLQD